jgi:hypothetical protein
MPDIRDSKNVNIYVIQCVDYLSSYFERVIPWSEKVRDLPNYLRDVRWISRLIADNPKTMASIFTWDPHLFMDITDVLKRSYPRETLVIIERCIEIMGADTMSEFHMINLMINIERLCQGTAYDSLGTKICDSSADSFKENCADVTRFIDYLKEIQDMRKN